MPNTQTPEQDKELKRILTDVVRIFKKYRDSNDLIHIALNKTQRDVSEYTLNAINAEVNKVLERLDGKFAIHWETNTVGDGLQAAIDAERQRYPVKEIK